MSSSILILFLIGDEVQELAPAASRVGLALQYRQEWPTSPFFCRGAPIDSGRRYACQTPGRGCRPDFCLV